MLTVYLVRHAHAEWTPSQARPLSTQGRAAAVLLAERLGSRPIAAIYSSPSRRAIETVAPLAARRGLTPALIDDLRERELTVPAGLTFDQAIAHLWSKPDVSFPASESNRTAQARAVNALHRVIAARPVEDVVVSTHGNLLALMLNGLDHRFDYAFWQALSFPDIYAVRLDGDTLVDLERLWNPT